MLAWLEQHKLIVFFSSLLMGLGVAGMTYLSGEQAPAATPIAIIEPTATATPTETPTPTATPSPTATATPTPSPTPAPLRVYVSGQVQTPDVYFLPPGSIIEDALTAAGGPTEQADLEVVNLALALKDQQQIHIPNQADNLPTPPVLSEGVAPTPPPPTATPLPETASAGSAAVSSSSAGGLININTASEEGLTAITGVGPATAAKIVAYREANGGFQSLEELMEVSGIGPVTFEKMKPEITLE